MLTLYVRKLPALCVLALMVLGALPAAAETDDAKALVAAYVAKGGDATLANTVLGNIAHPERMQVDQDPIGALMQTLAFKEPSKYAKAALEAKPITLPKPFKTTDLQRIYDKLVGTEKPLTILKNDREFLMVQASGNCELFADDTQFVVQESHIPFRVVHDDGYAGELRAPNVRRQIVLNGEEVIERTTITNDSSKPKQITVADSFNSDFKDMFEVRGWKRDKRGTVLPPVLTGNTLKLSYKGLDGVVMTTTIMTGPGAEASLSKDAITFKKTLPPHGSASYEFCIIPSPSPIKVVTYESARKQADSDYLQWRSKGGTIETDSADWNRMLERGWKDLYMLKQHTAGGEAIAAGTPWFAAPFGRDELITSLQMLAFRPDIAKNVLKLLAHYQGTKVDAYHAEKPGKIMHELRVGEMARNNEIAFNPYYGTVDATPLWVVLLGRYYTQTNDDALLNSLAGNLERALQFLQSESAETGYLRYGGNGKEALSNQGWKDSGDSVAYANGTLATPPIALSEVQGYLYEAYVLGSYLEGRLHNDAAVHLLNVKSTNLRTKFNMDFWMPIREYIALAVDGNGKQVDVVSSDAGHLLRVPFLRDDYAKLVSKRLMDPELFTGFGIRTLSSVELRYFPNSYHNGSVWPHDVSLICDGMHLAEPDNTAKIADALLSAAKYQNDFRLPELFGGYARDKQNVPIPYPVSCEPQAWAAGTPFLVLTACSGVQVDAPSRTVTIAYPRLPMSISNMILKNLPVGKRSTISLRFTRTPKGTDVQVLANPDKLSVNVIK